MMFYLRNVVLERVIRPAIRFLAWLRGCATGEFKVLREGAGAARAHHDTLVPLRPHLPHRGKCFCFCFDIEHLILNHAESNSVSMIQYQMSDTESC